MDLLDLVQRDGIELRRVASTHGGEYAGACPLCGGTDRFRVWPEQGEGGRWWCRQCQRSGDVLQYLREVRRMSFKEACQYAGKDMNNQRPSLTGKGGSRATREPQVSAIPADIWQSKARELVKESIYHLWAPQGRRWLGWLHEKRGLNEETIKASSLGLMPIDRYAEREDWGLERVLKDDGSPKKLWLPEGLVIPCFDQDQITSIRFRRPKSAGDPRYYLLPGSVVNPMVLHPERDIFVVVESHLDGLLLSQEAGAMVGVVVLGSAQTRPDQELANLLKCSRLILVALDADEAGAKEAWNWWVRHFPQAMRWPPLCKDPGEMWLAGIGLQDWIAVGIDYYAEEIATIERKETILIPSSPRDEIVIDHSCPPSPPSATPFREPELQKATESLREIIL